MKIVGSSIVFEIADLEAMLEPIMDDLTGKIQELDDEAVPYGDRRIIIQLDNASIFGVPIRTESFPA